MIKSKMRVTPANTSGTTTPTAIGTIRTPGPELLSVVDVGPAAGEGLTITVVGVIMAVLEAEIYVTA